ncbi:lytic transglycosylase domain-containing protein [Hydrogenophaga electricum]|nr:lytic transglycosylase domain-containing protein [Hydrogenophaga electricum]
MLDCPDLAVPREVMQHVVHVESSLNPFAIGVVGGYLARQPRSLDDALEAVQTLKDEGYNFSVGIAQVNRYNLAKYGLQTYAQAFEVCPNLQAGARILRECYDRARDWGKAFSCYYSGNFVTGFEHGYVQKIFASMRRAQDQAVQTAEVRIIPYNNAQPRKPARDDGVPLRAGEGAPPTTTAVAPAQPAAPANSPSPGMIMPPTGAGAGRGLAGIPLQVVGGDGNPYQTRIVPAAPQPGPAATAPGAQLPLPHPDAPLAARPASRRVVSREAKGGALLHIPESSGLPENRAGRSPDGAREPASPADASPSDKSFVF